ncbi:MAG: Do family serine endopeptidase, partial [Puniceicoccales bacterium]
DEDQGDQRRIPSGMGSGVIISPEGYILTNNHVVRAGRSNEIADEILVQLADGREFKAELVGTDEGTDLAILKIDADESLPALTFADSEKLRVGDVCFAIGNPLGVGLTVTRGIVSAMDRSIGILGGGYEDFIQTDAAINMGNSGGALIDAKGRLIGINTAILSRTGGNIGIGFAIPANMARYVMESLIEHGEVSRGFLGVAIGDLTPDLSEAWGLSSTKGALVLQVQENSAASEAGLRHRDVIVEVDGKEIDSSTELRLTISQIPPGETVELKILRDGKEIMKNVTLGSLGEQAASTGVFAPEKSPIENVVLESLTPELRKEYSIPSSVNGVLIGEIERMTPQNQQFRPGMVIREVNGVEVASPEDVSEALRKGLNTLYVWYENIPNFLTYTLP